MMKLATTIIAVIGFGSGAAAAEQIACTSTTFRLFGANDRVCISAFDLFKETKVVRMYDEKRRTLVYVAISRKVIEGSPMNSISTVPVMPWQGR